MNKLNKTAARILDTLCEGIEGPGDHKKVDNSEGTFMAVHVECIGQTDADNLMISVAHYFKQNGDMCKDPDMVFLKGTPVMDGEPSYYYPMTFQQDLPPVYQEAMRVEGQRILVAPRLQRDLVSFANGWMKNIKGQQGLKVSRRAA